ncbi:DUF5673 domain-containing protein [uncultured Clostridium sp.]|uniref:DUF5673 domain-containing protein n=1 Tax=uncultured Clostridium sp. TaxID=59620 RepID=UPI0025E487C4|nr:DUF5673 domain-containing protein [uncultured Clostridium sp.]
MDFLTILGVVFILGVTFIIFLKERKYKLIYKGRSQYFYMVPFLIIFFVAATLISGKTFKPADILVLIALIPLAFVGNKCGITEEGVLLSSYLTRWEKIQAYSTSEKNSRLMFFYESNGMTRKITFSKETGEEVLTYLSKNRKVRHRKKS